MMNDQYDDENDYEDDEIIDIEGAKRRKKKKTKKGGCCGGMTGGVTYQQMIKKIAQYNRKKGTKKIAAGVGSTKAAVTRAYKKIRGGIPNVGRVDKYDDMLDALNKRVPFSEDTGIIDNIKTWPVSDIESFIDAAISGRIKSLNGLNRYVADNYPTVNVLENPDVDNVSKKYIRCDYNAETMDLCRRLSKLEREFERKYNQKIGLKTAFVEKKV